MAKEVIVIGAGGHGRVVSDIIKQSGDRVLGFLDDADVKNLPMLGKIRDCEKYKDKYVIIAIGNNEIRRKIAIISPVAKIGKGSCVMSLAVVNSDATIGEHSIINTHATVEHDCVIDNFVHISRKCFVIHYLLL